MHNDVALMGESLAWVVRRDVFPVPVRVVELQLRGNHRLSFEEDAPAASAEEAPDHYEYPLEGPTVNVEWNKSNWGALSPAWKTGSDVFTSAPLSRLVVIYGPASVELWISSTKSDTDVQVPAGPAGCEQVLMQPCRPNPLLQP